MWSVRGRLPELRSERGTSSLELVLYMPTLMTVIFLTVQFSLVYLGNQVISSSARQAGRVARSVGNGDPAIAQSDAKKVARDYAAKVGYGLVTKVDVEVTLVETGASGQEMRVVVSGQALQLVPGVAAPRVSKTVQGPVEVFRPDLP
jgi:Flp pilus assembly protein TadG